MLEIPQRVLPRLAQLTQEGPAMMRGLLDRIGVRRTHASAGVNAGSSRQSPAAAGQLLHAGESPAEGQVEASSLTLGR
jgi:hypothetical protein